ncbi:PREDICTED: intraflagellar transport protein 57 homolog [Vollenhovia emeryi]|uniref:intraflagellar transport protein 57 homolog n=1 Tax=Vollenhovia emeryi TaxID=411798 RepID=UPI0005F5081F|nr:PREDICTED: intraflagellar transport protein 57 homolog [Vollenhovia emeryi]
MFRLFRDAPKIGVKVCACCLKPLTPCWHSVPPLQHVLSVRVGDLLEKLMLLNYDAEFVQELKLKPIVTIVTRHFILSTDPDEQFYTFTCLAVWLIRKAGRSFEMPQESDDPNSTIALILNYLREIEIPVEFPPQATNELKEGYGETAVYILDKLADNALKVAEFAKTETIKTDSRDWRAHPEQMKQLCGNITTNLSGTKTHLSKISTDTGNTFDKIKTYLNRQLEPSLTEYRSLQEDLSKIKEQYRDVSGSVTERTRALNKLMEELEDHMKREMDERGSSMTEGTPLINIKKTITRMRNEIAEMNIEIRIGVLEYSLMCAQVQDCMQLRKNMKSTSISVIAFLFVTAIYSCTLYVLFCYI